MNNYTLIIFNILFVGLFFFGIYRIRKINTQIKTLKVKGKFLKIILILIKNNTEKFLDNFIIKDYKIELSRILLDDNLGDKDRDELLEVFKDYKKSEGYFIKGKNRIVLNEEDYESLISGKVIKKDDTDMLLQDIGYDKMIKILLSKYEKYVGKDKMI